MAKSRKAPQKRSGSKAAKPKSHPRKPKIGACVPPTREDIAGLSYGQASARLDEILHVIEEGDVDLDDVSGLVTEAAELIALCKDKIESSRITVVTIAERLAREAPAGADIDADDE